MATHRAASACGPVLGDRLAKQLILVLRGAPSAVDVELDAVVGGIRRRFAQGLEQIGVEIGHAGILVIKHRHAVGEDTVLLGQHVKVVSAASGSPSRDVAPPSRRRCATTVRVPASAGRRASR